VLLGHARLNISRRRLLEEIINSHPIFISNSTRLLNDGGIDSSSADGGYPDDVKREVNSYFLHMFTGQLNKFSLVQKLTRYKESHEK
ncbi:hypothetical protein MKX01_014165, partial [Papaver californicum]